MKILSVSGILPVPNLIKENDIIFHIYDHLQELYPETEVEFIRTIPYSNFLLSQVKDKWKRYYEVIKKRQYWDREYKVTIFPHFIFKSNANTYAFLTKATYYQNFFRIRQFEDVDIIHAHRLFSEGPLAYKIARKFSKPLAVTVRKETKYFNNGYAEKKADEILSRAAFITTPSPNTYALLNKKYPQKSHLIPHGVDQRFFIEQKVSDSNSLRILTVGKLVELKNIEKVIKALSRLKNNYNFIYQIVGDGPHRDAIQQCIQDHNMQSHVEMSSHIPYEEIHKVYSQADIFAMVSYPETFGRVYFEAMAAGVPIICAKNTAIHGLFEERESGFSVDHENVTELKNILAKLFTDKELRTRVGKKGKELVSNYSWPKIVERYRTLYIDALK